MNRYIKIYELFEPEEEWEDIDDDHTEVVSAIDEGDVTYIFRIDYYITKDLIFAKSICVNRNFGYFNKITKFYKNTELDIGGLREATEDEINTLKMYEEMFKNINTENFVEIFESFQFEEEWEEELDYYSDPNDIKPSEMIHGHYYTIVYTKNYGYFIKFKNVNRYHINTYFLCRIDVPYNPKSKQTLYYDSSLSHRYLKIRIPTEEELNIMNKYKTKNESFEPEIEWEEESDDSEYIPSGFREFLIKKNSLDKFISNFNEDRSIRYRKNTMGITDIVSYFKRVPRIDWVMDAFSWSEFDEDYWSDIDNDWIHLNRLFESFEPEIEWEEESDDVSFIFDHPVYNKKEIPFEVGDKIRVEDRVEIIGNPTNIKIGDTGIIKDVKPSYSNPEKFMICIEFDRYVNGHGSHGKIGHCWNFDGEYNKATLIGI